MVYKSLEENLVENGTSLGTTTSAQHRNHTDKVDAQANEQGTIITTVKVLEPTKITKTITYEDNHKEGVGTLWRGRVHRGPQGRPLQGHPPRRAVEL